MKRSIHLLSSLTIITSLVACAEDGQTSRSKSSSNSGGPQSTEAANEADYTTLDSTFNISSATLNDLKDSNRSLGYLIRNVNKDLAAVIADCEKISTQRNKLLSGLEPIAGELGQLQIKSGALADQIQVKRKAQTDKNNALAAMRGNVAAVKTEIANFNGDFKKKMAAAIDRINDNIERLRKDLKNVEKDINSVLAALPYDAVKYAALDVSRDNLNDQIDQLVQERVQLRASLAATARADLKTLQDRRAALQLIVDQQSPALIKDIVSLRAEILELLKAKKATDAEIGNDKDAQALRVAELPAGCVKLLAR